MSAPISPYIRMMDISLNLARVGNWTADSLDAKKQLIAHFLMQTDQYLQELLRQPISKDVKPVLNQFEKEFKKLRDAKVNKNNKDMWAERALTWANILQHRAKLA